MRYFLFSTNKGVVFGEEWKNNGERPLLLFTIETLTLTRKALIPFELTLQRSRNQSPKVVFAVETVARIKGKLPSLIENYDVQREVSFDYNEVVVLYGALRMYMMSLAGGLSSLLVAKEMLQCKVLCDYFGRVSRRRVDD